MNPSYLDILHDKVATWIKQNPADYKALRAEVWESIRRAGQSEPVKGTFSRKGYDAAVVEAIRKRIGFPSERAHEAGQRLPV